MSPCALRTKSLREVAHGRAELRVGLHRDLVVAAEAGELVHLVAAQEHLQRREHVVDGHAQLLHLLAVDVEPVVGRRRGEGRRDAADRRAAVRGRHELCGHGRELLRLGVPRASSIAVKPDTAPKPGSAGGLNGMAMASGMCASLAISRRSPARAPPGRSFHGFSRTIDERAVRCRRAGDQVVAGDAGHRDPGLAHDLLDLRAATATVRCCEAASGRMICMKIAPLSSSGTNPVGVMRSSPTMREDHDDQDGERRRARGARRVPAMTRRNDD